MRWQGKPSRGWTPWFAFLPMRWHDDRMIWLEPIWVHCAGDYSVWCPWEEMPNQPQAEGPGRNDASPTPGSTSIPLQPDPRTAGR